MRNYLILGAAFSLLAGCAPFQHTEAPLASNFTTTKQMKLQAGHHWQVVADDMADTIAAALAKTSPCVAPAGNCPSLFVAPTRHDSTFGKAFHSQFLSRLVNKGQNVSVQGPGDIAVTVEAQTVRFSPDRDQYLGVGKFTMLSTGIWALRGINVQSGIVHGAGHALVAGAVAADIYQWNMSEFAKGPTPQIELILTASATKGGQFLARTTNVYYISDSDATLYCWKAEECGVRYLPPPPTLRVVGDCGPAPCISTGMTPSGGTSK